MVDDAGAGGAFGRLVNWAGGLFESAPDPKEVKKGHALFNKIVKEGLGGDGVASSPVSDISLKAMQNEGLLVELRKDDVTKAFSDVTKARPDGYFEVPVLVVAGLGKDATDTPEARLLKSSDGHNFILVNEAYHKWNEDYVREHIMIRDDKIEDARKMMQLENPGDLLSSMAYIAKIKEQTHNTNMKSPGSAEVATAQRRYDELLRFVHNSADEMGVKSPTIYIDKTGDDKNPGTFSSDIAAATTSNKDKNYVFLHKSTLMTALFAASDKEMDIIKADVGHELAHVGNGDTRPAGIMAARSGATMRYEETMADLRGTGPLGSRDPEVMAKFFEGELRAYVPNYVAEHKGSRMTAEKATDDDLKKVSQWLQDKYPEPSHPSYWDRMASLKREALLMKDYEKGHPLQDQKGRQAEAQFVEAQVLKDMDGKRQLTVENATGRQTEPPAELSDTQRVEIANIRAAMKQAAEDIQLAGMPALDGGSRRR